MPQFLRLDHRMARIASHMWLRFRFWFWVECAVCRRLEVCFWILNLVICLSSRVSHQTRVRPTERKPKIHTIIFSSPPPNSALVLRSNRRIKRNCRVSNKIPKIIQPTIASPRRNIKHRSDFISLKSSSLFLSVKFTVVYGRVEKLSFSTTRISFGRKCVTRVFSVAGMPRN